MNTVIKYGDIVVVKIADDSAKEDEQPVRYAVVVSADIMNEHLPTVIVCPMIASEQVRESRIGATFISREQTGFEHDYVILSLQLKTISKNLIIRRVATLPVQFQSQLKESLLAVLELEERI